MSEPESLRADVSLGAKADTVSKQGRMLERLRLYLLRAPIPFTHECDPTRLVMRAYEILCHYERTHKLNDLKNAVAFYRRALHLIPDEHQDKPYWLNNLGYCLICLFSRSGMLHALESSISTFQVAVKLTLSDDPQLPRRLSNLAISLWARFGRFGQPEDLESAIDAFRGTVELTPGDDLQLPWQLSNMACSLRTRFNCFGRLGDLESAIDAFRGAVELTPGDDPQLPGRLSNLAASLWARFDRFGQPEDLESALNADRRAVELTPGDDPQLPGRLSNLAASLWARFNRFGRPEDLASCIDALRRAVELTPDGHPDKLRFIKNLGSALLSRFTHDCTNDNFNGVVECYLVAMNQSTGYPNLRFQSVEAYVGVLSNYPEFRAPDSLLLGYSHVMNSLPELVWLGHSIQRRFQESARVGVLVNASVCVAIEIHDLERAVEWLEAGRSLIWSQFASMRTPLDDLAEQLPDMAHDLHDVQLKLQELAVAAEIDTLDTRNPDIARDGLGQRHAYVDSAADRYRRVAIRYDNLVKEIRSCDGFEDFMRPKKLAEFITSPVFARLNAPVVFINVAKSSCDALILLPNGTVKLVELPGLTQKHADTLRNLWTEIVGLRRAQRRGGDAPRAACLTRGWFNVYNHVLDCLWTWVVQPVLEELDYIKESEAPEKPLPHVIWCPTGPLTQLPLHAAGIYDRARPGPRTFDYVVSSYTPSLSALLRCLGKHDVRHVPPSMLLVAQTNTPRPGLNALPHVRDESARIRTLLHGDEHTFLEDDQATVQSVLPAIKQHTWVHFACHGSQHPRDPTLTSVELYDKPLTLGDLMHTASDNAELAFLSACQTAVGDKKVPEESAHLAAGMLAVGFKGVVATMWSIYDEDGPVIVEAYYKKLLELRASGTVPRGHTGAAYALHHAAKCLREKVGQDKFERWVPFVHFGV